MNHGMVWIGRGLKDHLIPSPLPWAGIIDQEGESLLVGLRDINVTARPWFSSILLENPGRKGGLAASSKLGACPSSSPDKGRENTQFLHSQQGQIPNLLGFID